MHIEVGEVKETHAQSFLDSRKAVLKGQVESTGAVRGVSEGLVRVCGHDQVSVHVLWGAMMIDDHVATNQIGSVGTLLAIQAGVVDQLLLASL